MISIEIKHLNKSKYDHLIEEFVSKKYEDKLFPLNQIVLFIKYYNRFYIFYFNMIQAKSIW